MKEFYSDYEILELVRLEKNGKPTAHNFCITKNPQEQIDIIAISYLSSESEEGYETTQSIIVNSATVDKKYSINNIAGCETVEFII